jgi:FkbM family methyltransferase
MREKRITAKLAENLNFLMILKNPLAYLRDCLGLIKGDSVIYKLRGGAKYKVRPGTCDRGIIKEIYLYRCYDPENLPIGESDIILDIGAQIGIFSVYAAKAAKNGRVFSFEPVPENFRLLKENAELNGCANVSIFEAAVAEKSGLRKILVAADNTGGHSFVDAGQKVGGSVEVKSFSLPEFMADHKIEEIDFLKIDCEGGEYEIFYNLPAEILGKIKKISMEYHDLDKERSGEKMKEFLIADGFKVAMTSGKFPMIYASR